MDGRGNRGRGTCRITSSLVGTDAVVGTGAVWIQDLRRDGRAPQDPTQGGIPRPDPPRPVRSRPPGPPRPGAACARRGDTRQSRESHRSPIVPLLGRARTHRSTGRSRLWPRATMGEHVGTPPWWDPPLESRASDPKGGVCTVRGDLKRRKTARNAGAPQREGPVRPDSAKASLPPSGRCLLP